MVGWGGGVEGLGEQQQAVRQEAAGSQVSLSGVVSSSLGWLRGSIPWPPSPNPSFSLSPYPPHRTVLLPCWHCTVLPPPARPAVRGQGRFPSTCPSRWWRWRGQTQTGPGKREMGGCSAERTGVGEEGSPSREPPFSPSCLASRVRISPESPSASPARQLVAELMILAGEVAGRFGGERRLPLPYRGQLPPVLPPAADLQLLPEGPCRAAALRRCMTRSLGGCRSPLAHAGLGLEAYVQVTSPIRRYGDLLAHFQVSPGGVLGKQGGGGASPPLLCCCAGPLDLPLCTCPFAPAPLHLPLHSNRGCPLRRVPMPPRAQSRHMGRMGSALASAQLAHASIRRRRFADQGRAARGGIGAAGRRRLSPCRRQCRRCPHG